MGNPEAVMFVLRGLYVESCLNIFCRHSFASNDSYFIGFHCIISSDDKVHC